MAAATAIRQRLLKDIKEIQSNPYPGINFFVQDNLTQACLILWPEGEPPLHLTIDLTNYPIRPPNITIQSKVSHPNVFDERICISLLECREGYTPAYTIKGICIQMLSFFSSDKLEQMWGENGGLVDLKQWHSAGKDGFGFFVSTDTYCCNKCGFDGKKGNITSGVVAGKKDISNIASGDTLLSDARMSNSSEDTTPLKAQLTDLPNDVLLILCDQLDDEALLLAASAWSKIADLINEHNIIRTRELQCFTLRQDFRDADLGVGIHIGRRKIESEFDLVSREAYETYSVRRSIHGLPFELWLPLPLAERHWERVKGQADITLNRVARKANISGSLDQVLYAMMNGIVVRLSAASEQVVYRGNRPTVVYGVDGDLIKSSLTHASEKAIESYFHLFHLLLCYAVERPAIANAADKLINDFVHGSRDKQSCPNIGHLLIAILISDAEVTEPLTKAIIKESITRNVVWMLEPQPGGKGYAELSYLEPSAISTYRLQKTFDAGKTSYRLLMFLNLMRNVVRSARNNKNGDKMTLQQLRNYLFSRHGAPPAGAVARMAQQIRDIQRVTGFPEFLKNMGIEQPPTMSAFTAFLRSTISDSMQRGYSRWALTQEQALNVRIHKEGPQVERIENIEPHRLGDLATDRITFFPQQSTASARRGRGRPSGRNHGGRDRGGHR